MLGSLRDGSIYGAYGVTAMAEMYAVFEKERFKAWTILQGLDMDNHAGNFGTVEI